MGYRLGLDLGPTSIGWAVVDADGGRVLDAGVRVFPEGVDRNTQGAEVSKNAARRLARQARRQLDRRKRRWRAVRAVLAGAGMWPGDAAAAAMDPYRLRARALAERLDPGAVGVALHHVGRRRGFRSSRKGSRDADGSKVHDGINELQRAMDAAGTPTLGAYLRALRDAAGPGREHLVRLRGRYTLRAMHEAEFDAIWSAQRGFDPELYPDDLRERLRRAIFHQRPLKPADELVGFCELEPKERRCPVAHRAAQRFRMLQEVNNLRVIDAAGAERELPSEGRRAVLDLLAAKEKATFDQVRGAAGLGPEDRLNLENGKRAHLWGHRTDHEMRKKALFGKAWDALPEGRKDHIVERVVAEDDPDALAAEARREWGLGEEAARALAGTSLQGGYMGFSLKAIRRLLPHMEAGFPLRVRDGARSALTLAGYLGPDQRPRAVLDRLDAPPGDVRNPLVRAALHQTKRVVNAIIARHGKPAAVHVELAREAKGSLAQRAERAFETRARERRRSEIADRLREELPQFKAREPSRDDVRRFLLWEDLGGECPYTGEKIGLARLFSPEVQVDHILPYPRSLDDSYGNKVVCLQRANAEKGHRTPHEWLSGDPERFALVQNRVRRLWAIGQGGKARKFAQATCELEDFVARQLVDTAYITRQVGAYLGRLGADVVCVRGQTTADLRWRWGLDTVLRDDALRVKNREDHRHHAVDAIVVALTDRERLHALAGLGKGGGAGARAAARLARREAAAVVDERTGEVLADAQPWPGFREQVLRVVEPMRVSHRPRRRVSGALHEDTRYAPAGEAGLFVVRKPLHALSPTEARAIRDPAVRRVVLARLAEHGADLRGGGDPAPAAWAKATKSAFAAPLRMRTRAGNEGAAPEIRTVRVLRRDDTITRLGAGAGWVKPGANHHAAIFELPAGPEGKVRRVAVWTNRLEAARRVRDGEPLVRRTHPDHPDARLVMVLCPGDLVLADFGHGERVYRFKTGSSTQGQLFFADARDARPDGRAEKFSAKANTTTKYKVRPVTVDLLGAVRSVEAPPASAHRPTPAVGTLARAAIAEGLTNTQAHKRLKAAGLGKMGAQLTAALKALRTEPHPQPTGS